MTSDSRVPAGKLKGVVLYTDGSAFDNPGGPGGWAAVIVIGDSQSVISGGVKSTTNNRMEVTAAIEGLRQLDYDADVLVRSDSLYLVNSMSKRWRRNANEDLWEKLDAEVWSRRVWWQWVRGHAGVPGNELANKAAYDQAVAVCEDLEYEPKVTEYRNKPSETPDSDLVYGKLLPTNTRRLRPLASRR